MFKVIQTAKAPAAIGPYSQATQVGNFIFLSGQIGLDPATSSLVSDDCEVQLQQIFKNMNEVLVASGANFSHIVKLTVYLKDLNHFSVINDMMKKVFKEPYPARTTIEVSGLPKNALVELDAIVVL